MFHFLVYHNSKFNNVTNNVRLKIYSIRRIISLFYKWKLKGAVKSELEKRAIRENLIAAKFGHLSTSISSWCSFSLNLSASFKAASNRTDICPDSSWTWDISLNRWLSEFFRNIYNQNKYFNVFLFASFIQLLLLLYFNRGCLCLNWKPPAPCICRD